MHTFDPKIQESEADIFMSSRPTSGKKKRKGNTICVCVSVSACLHVCICTLGPRVQVEIENLCGVALLSPMWSRGGLEPRNLGAWALQPAPLPDEPFCWPEFNLRQHHESVCVCVCIACIQELTDIRGCCHPLEQDLKISVDYHVGTGNQAWVFCKKSKLLRHLFSTLSLPFIGAY